MSSALRPDLNRVLTALARYRKAVGLKPDSNHFHDLSHVEKLDFLSSIVESTPATPVGVSADFRQPNYVETLSVCSKPVVEAKTEIGTNTESTLDSETDNNPTDPDRTKIPGRFETDGHGKFALSDGSVVVPLSSSDRLADYKLFDELGRGGLSVVYRARQKALNHIVAFKMVLAGSHACNTQLARFKAEARAVARLEHPNFVQDHDIDEHDGLPLFTMDYVDGGALDSLVKKQSMEAMTSARVGEHIKAMRLIVEGESRVPKRSTDKMTYIFLDAASTASLSAQAVGNGAGDDKLKADQKALAKNTSPWPGNTPNARRQPRHGP